MIACICYYNSARTCEHVTPPRKFSGRVANRRRRRGDVDYRRIDISVVGWHAWTSQGADYYAFSNWSKLLRDGRPRRFRR